MRKARTLRHAKRAPDLRAIATIAGHDRARSTTSPLATKGTDLDPLARMRLLFVFLFLLLLMMWPSGLWQRLAARRRLRAPARRLTGSRFTLERVA
jgi:hypothetical protein